MKPTDFFIIRLPNEKMPTYRIFSILISVLCAACMLLISFSVKKDGLDYVITLASFGSLLGPLLGWVLLKKEKEWYLRNTIAATLVSGIGFIILGYWLGALVIMLSILGMKAIKSPLLQCTETGLAYPSFFPKKISWKEIDTIQIKDNILTIDLKNNQLMQFTLNEKDNPALDEVAFNDFVKKYI